MEDINPDTFRVFVQWLYSQTLTHIHREEDFKIYSEDYDARCEKEAHSPTSERGHDTPTERRQNMHRALRNVGRLESRDPDYSEHLHPELLCLVSKSTHQVYDQFTCLFHDSRYKRQKR